MSREQWKKFFFKILYALYNKVLNTALLTVSASNWLLSFFSPLSGYLYNVEVILIKEWKHYHIFGYFLPSYCVFGGKLFIYRTKPILLTNIITRIYLCQMKSDTLITCICLLQWGLLWFNTLLNVNKDGKSGPYIVDLEGGKSNYCPWQPRGYHGCLKTICS